jgi:hypothetical protein
MFWKHFGLMFFFLQFFGLFIHRGGGSMDPPLWGESALHLKKL